MTAFLIAAIVSIVREGEAQATQTPRELLGEWVATKGEAEGVELTPSELKAMSVGFVNDGIQISPSAVEFGSSPNPAKAQELDTAQESWPIRIDATKNPGWLDIELGRSGFNLSVFGTEFERGKPFYNHCIYKLEGDTLTICWGEQQRPTSFKTKPGDGLASITYRRKK